MYRGLYILHACSRRKGLDRRVARLLRPVPPARRRRGAARHDAGVRGARSIARAAAAVWLWLRLVGRSSVGRAGIVSWVCHSRPSPRSRRGPASSFEAIDRHGCVVLGNDTARITRERAPRSSSRRRPTIARGVRSQAIESIESTLALHDEMQEIDAEVRSCNVM